MLQARYFDILRFEDFEHIVLMKEEFIGDFIIMTK